LKVINTNLRDCLVIEPEVFEDERGFFLETYNSSKYLKEAGINEKFVQDNHSRSSKNVLRGLHFQKNNPQGKLVRVSLGSVFDVVVDIRQNSPTFSNWMGIYLSEENKKQVWVPPGFAHGFLVLSDNADFVYKCTDYYDPNNEFSILWDDPDIGIKWPSNHVILSKKDQNGLRFSEIF
jgi:dTDP-4-dehydrorhamnose 3,5-epimerase